MQGFIIGALNFLFGMLNWIPDAPVQALNYISTALNSLVLLMGQLNYILPVQDIVIMLGFYASYKLVIFTIFGVNWIIRRIHDLIP